ncbi:MAG: holo-ACP synthase [Methanoregula sp.]|jgi:holo-[acyl-carrier protein] synthase|uniref:holo-ACP synthase n=1 Tax=Methanoregula sp. TaxID=2052170 RepID=UPI003D0C1761
MTGTGNDHRIGIGTDIESVRRFVKLPHEAFRVYEKIFTESEIACCLAKHSPAQHFAARFAGKEAVIKALADLGAAPAGYTEIEIENTPDGVPKAILKDPKYSNIQVNISLTHGAGVAMGFAVARILDHDD